MMFLKKLLKYNSTWNKLKPIDLAKIEVVPFPDNCFFREEYSKEQIVLHHTISGDGVEGDIKTWEGEPGIATCIIIDRAGTPWQLFSSKYWAYHLGVSNNNHYLHKHSIGVELDNWGWLIAGDGTEKQFGQKTVKTQFGKYYTYYGNPVAVPLQYYSDGFRGYNYYEKYSESQIRTLGELILYWNLKYKITLKYNEDMWGMSQRALEGVPGIWSHVSYRPPNKKQDCHPQPELIEMLKTLEYIN
jgi:N-acetyl-anhydromuramyl-L-alanine amidase AmpD